jgi:hypothetical protein
MTNALLLSSYAISEYSFYGVKSKKLFKISRNSIRINASSKSHVNFNKWIISSKLGVEICEILSIDNEWLSTIHDSSPRLKDKYFFGSAEQALAALLSHIDEEITPFATEE